MALTNSRFASRFARIPAQRAPDGAGAVTVEITPVALPRPWPWTELSPSKGPGTFRWVLMVGHLVAGLGGAALVGFGPMALGILAAWVSMLALADGYRRPLFATPTADVRRSVTVAATLVLALEGAAWLFPGQPWRTMLPVVLLPLAASILTVALSQAKRRLGLSRLRAVVIGGTSTVGRTVDLLRDRAARDLTLVGTYSLDSGEPQELAGLRALVEERAADLVMMIPGSEIDTAQARRIQWLLETSRADLCVIPGVDELSPRRTELTSVGAVPLLEVRPPRLKRPMRVVKEAWERTAAVAVLVLAAPLMGLLMMLIRMDSPGPALYRQERLGRNGRPFTMMKLRTMSEDAHDQVDELSELNEADGVLFKLQSDPRITRLGGFLRKYSIDELPQLWNVVKGDMSLVGPRPPLPKEVGQYDHDASRRLAVKPGLTGLWQVSGRSDLSWSESVRLDLYYVDNWSLRLDLLVVLRTFRAVLSHRGAY